MPDAPASAPPAAAPPPAAPSPAAAPSTPPASTPPAPKNEGGSWLDSVERDLEDLAGDRPDPAAGKPPKPDEGKPGDKPPDEPGKPAGDQPPVRPMKTADLRTNYEALKKEKAEVLQPRIQQLEAKVKEFEGRNGEAEKAATEKLTAIEKRNAELEAHIQFVDYQKSSEFKTKYAAPFNDAYNRAVADFHQLTANIPDGEDEITHEPKFKQRPATAEDLLYLANLPLSEMDAQAEAMFGRSAARVIRHVERVRELSDAQNRAIEEAQHKAGDWVKGQAARREQSVKRNHELWSQFNKEIAQRFPKVFGPDDADPDGNALLQKGFAQADRLFAPDKNAPPQSPEERVQFHALLRHKIANHDRLVRRLKLVNAELEEAKKSLKDYEASAPPAGRAGTARAVTPGFMQEAEAEIEKLDKR